MSNLYPFTLYPKNNGHSPGLANKLWFWLRRTPALEGTYPYAFGVEIDEHSLTLELYRVADPVCGGVGACILRHPVPRVGLPDGVQADLVKAEIQHAERIAEMEVERLDREAYARRVAAQTKKMFPFLYGEANEHNPVP
jgi:hypothetical protein